MLVLSLRGEGATLPNCGKTLKLQIPSQRSKGSGGQVNCLGYGHNSEDITKWAIRSQAPVSLLDMEKVQRLDGSG
jgi:hypothetical protein